jgi:hypothetical protein
MSGYIKIGSEKYDNSADFGAGLHLAVGADWIISRRIQASFRVGQRFMKIKESHKESDGWYTLYVNDDPVSAKWNGPYASLGLSWSFYAKLKLGRPE